MNERISCTTDAENIYFEYKDKIYAYIINKIQNFHEAEDLLSDVFLKIINSFDSYDPSKASWSTWVYTITHNTVNNYYRKKSTHKEDCLLEDKTQIADYECLPEDCLLEQEQLDNLADALECLAQRERDIIILRFYHEYSPMQIANVMGISYNNVKVIQVRAIKKLKKILHNGGK